ncbi:MAG: hypothetical protein KatS3mg068_1343 [Candidatus Sericytochromatia bacterium]|nr:MAG: hypothetical protein KatS3mg068_1343 [Candidatus Sericytochromatia bacterium]
MKKINYIFKFFRKFSARTYLVAMGLMVSATPIFLLSIINYNFMSNDIINLIERKNLLLVESFSNKVKLYIDLNSKIIKLISGIIYDKNDNFIRNAFSNVLKTYTDIEIISYVNHSKVWIQENNNFYITDTKRFKINQESILNKIKNKDYLYIYLKEYSNNLCIIYPVFDKNKNISGFIFATLKLNRFNKYSEYVFKYNEEPFIYDISEDIVLNYPKNIFVYKEFLKKELEKNSNIGIIKLSNKIITYSKISEPNLFVCLIHSLDEYYKEIANKHIKIIIGALISLSFSLFMALWISSYQSKFVKSFLKSIRAFSKGNYSDKVVANLLFIPKEFDLMIDEFNVMAEKIEKLDKFKSNLIDTVSHEFKTPLTSIKGFASTLMRKDANFDKDTTRKLLKIISSQVDRLSRMVEDLLVVPKIEGNTLVLRNEYVEFENILYSIIEFFPSCKFEISISDVKYVYCDSDRFEQIILNLCENACKYNYPKESIIKIMVTKENNYAKFIFSNKSKYIEKDKLDTLFDKFVRLDNDLTRTTGGTGLGLYITRALIELMKGKIFISYEDDEFKVIFTLPINENS